MSEPGETMIAIETETAVIVGDTPDLAVLMFVSLPHASS